jgi:hypothetical protein
MNESTWQFCNVSAREVPKTTVGKQDYTFDSFLPEYKRPCLTDPELTVLVKVLNQSAHFYRVNERVSKDKNDEVSAAQFENMAVACDGLATRFTDLLHGKKHERVKGSALEGKRMCYTLSKEFK